MHAWDTGRADDFPGWHRCVEYHPRADAICREVLPPLLTAVRKAGLSVLHDTSSARYCAALRLVALQVDLIPLRSVRCVRSHRSNSNPHPLPTVRCPLPAEPRLATQRAPCQFFVAPYCLKSAYTFHLQSVKDAKP